MITLLSFLFYLVHKDNIQWICIPFSQKCRFSSDFAFLTPESLHSHFWVFSSGQINLKGFHLETNSHIGSVLKHFVEGYVLCKHFAIRTGKIGGFFGETHIIGAYFAIRIGEIGVQWLSPTRLTK